MPGRVSASAKFLVCHLHVEHRELERHLGTANGGRSPGELEREAVRDRGPVRGDEDLDRIAVLLDHLNDLAGADVSNRRPHFGERLRGWCEAREECPAKTAHATITASPVTSRPNIFARRRPELRPLSCGVEMGLRAQKIEGREDHRRQQQADLDEDGLAVRRLPERSDGRHVDDGRAGARGDQHEHRDERDVGEARDRDAEACDPAHPAEGWPRRAAGRRAHRARSSRRRGAASRAAARGRAARSGPRAPTCRGRSSTAAAATRAPEVAANSAIDRCSRSGRSTQTAIHEATQKSAKQISMST